MAGVTKLIATPAVLWGNVSAGTLRVNQVKNIYFTSLFEKSTL